MLLTAPLAKSSADEPMTTDMGRVETTSVAPDPVPAADRIPSSAAVVVAVPSAAVAVVVPSVVVAADLSVAVVAADLSVVVAVPSVVVVLLLVVLPSVVQMSVVPSVVVPSSASGLESAILESLKE